MSGKVQIPGVGKSYVDRLLPITKEPTGFTEPENVIVTYDSNTRKVTLTGTVVAYWQGVLIPALVSGWVSAAHDDTNGVWFLQYNGATFEWLMTTSWTFEKLQIAFVNYQASDKYAIRECHGLMGWQTHKELHEVIGTHLESGGDIAGYVLNSTTASERRPTVSSTTIGDEDLITVNPLLNSSLYTKIKLVGAGATTTYTVETADIVPLNGANPYYNQYTGGAWQQTLMANNSYMAVWLVAVPVSASVGSQKYRYLWIQGQTNGTLSAIQSLTPSTLNLGQLATQATEFVFIGKVIIQYTAANWRIVQVDKLIGSRFSQVSLTGGIAGYVQKAGDTMTGDLRGKEFVPTRSKTITRNAGNFVTVVAMTGGRTLTITRDVNNLMTSKTDTINTWTPTRDANNYITAITVT